MYGKIPSLSGPVYGRTKRTNGVGQITACPRQPTLETTMTNNPYRHPRNIAYPPAPLARAPRVINTRRTPSLGVMKKGLVFASSPVPSNKTAVGYQPNIRRWKLNYVVMKNVPRATPSHRRASCCHWNIGNRLITMKLRLTKFALSRW